MQNLLKQTYVRVSHVVYSSIFLSNSNLFVSLKVQSDEVIVQMVHYKSLCSKEKEDILQVSEELDTQEPLFFHCEFQAIKNHYHY